MSKRKKTRRRQIKQVVTFNITHFPFIARTRQTGLATIEADLGGVGLLAIYWDSGEAEKENNERVQSFEVPSKRCCWKVGENSAPCPHLDHLWYRGVASQLRSSGTYWFMNPGCQYSLREYVGSSVCLFISFIPLRTVGYINKL